MAWPSMMMQNTPQLLEDVLHGLGVAGTHRLPIHHHRDDVLVVGAGKAVGGLGDDGVVNGFDDGVLIRLGGDQLLDGLEFLVNLLLLGVLLFLGAGVVMSTDATYWLSGS